MEEYIDEYPNWISGPQNFLPNALWIVAGISFIFFYYRSRRPVWLNALACSVPFSLILSWAPMVGGYAAVYTFWIYSVLSFTFLACTRFFQRQRWGLKYLIFLFLISYGVAYFLPLGAFLWNWQSTHSLRCALVRLSPYNGVYSAGDYTVCTKTYGGENPVELRKLFIELRNKRK